MKKDELLSVLKKLSEGFIDNKIEGNLYANIVESLVVLNLELVPELEDFADFLAQYHSPKDMPELYSDSELKEKIKKIFGMS